MNVGFLFKMVLFQFAWITILSCTSQQAANSEDVDWPMYSGDPSGSKYSSCSQINQENVKALTVAWTYQMDDARQKPASTIQCNPLVIDGVMYLTTPGLRLVALDASNGREMWFFDPFAGMPPQGVNRGVVSFRDEGAHKIFFVAGSNLYCIDALRGVPDSTFGTKGAVSLYEGLGREVGHLWVTAATPGIVYKNLIIMGTTLGEGPSPAAPGHIRAYNVHSGEMVWIFHTIPHPDEFGYDTWPEQAWQELGGANAWGGFTLDMKRGVVFCGTGSSTYDHWGGNRVGDNLFANCILALDAATGKRKWHYQVVHHDIWDYDIPCAPNLVQVKVDNKLVDAVAQPTKMGHLFVLDRDTGQPIFAVQEKEVPASSIPGEVTSPTQPFPPSSLRYADQTFTREQVTDVSEDAAAFVRRRLDSLDTGDVFLPPSERGAVTLPQFNGGTDWGGAAYDPFSRYLYVNASNEAEWISMVPSKPVNQISRYDFGKRTYQANCAVCHGNANPRNPGAPSLQHLRAFLQQKGQDSLFDLLKMGQGQMPKFSSLTDDEKDAIVDFLNEGGRDEILELDKLDLSYSEDIPWVATGHNVIKDHIGFPANKPPWGLLNAIDLDRGEIAWQVPLGTYPALEEQGLSATGTFNMGGPLVTAGGLVFIAATMDERFRAFDKDTGKQLWMHQMDAGGYATPSTYMINGKQYIIIAAGGGGKPGTKAGDKYYCFALPE